MAIKRIIELPEVKYICIDDIAFLCSKNLLHANGIFLDNKKFELLNNRYSLWERYWHWYN